MYLLDRFSWSFHQREDICVNFLNLVQFFRFLKGRCHGNQYSGKKWGKITYPSALIALSIQNVMGYRDLNVRVNSADYASISCKNFVNFGPVTPEKTGLICILYYDILWYCNPFSNDSAKNASGISRRSWHFPKINWLSWQCPSTNRKTRYRSIICTQSTFIWWKDCKNRSTISWDICLNMPVFCHVAKKYTNEPRFSWVTGPKFTKFLHNIEALFALLTHI